MSVPVPRPPVDDAVPPDAPPPAPARRARRPLRTLLRVVLPLLLLAVVAGAALLRFVLWPEAFRWREQAVQAASGALGRPLSVDAARTGWDGWRPTLALEGVELRDAAGGVVLRVRRLEAVLSWRSLPARQPRFAMLRLDGAEVEAVREADGGWRVAGFRPDERRPEDRAGLAWLLAQRRVDVSGLRVTLRDDRPRGAAPLQVLDVAATLRNVGRNHRFMLRTARAGDAAGLLEWQGDFTHPVWGRAVEFERWQGEGWLSADGVDLSRLRAWWPGTPPAMLPLAGRASLHASLDADGRRVAAAVVRLGARDLRLAAVHGAPVRLDRVRVDAALLREDDGWHLRVNEAALHEAGGVKLALDGVPASLNVDLLGGLRSVSLRLGTVDVAATAVLLRRLPGLEALRPGLDRLGAASGRLQGTRVEWKRSDRADEAADWRVDARFERLTVPARPVPATDGRPQAGRPGFARLSGQFSARPDGGEVELDARDAVLEFPGIFEQPAIPFARLEGRLEWTAHAAGDEDGPRVRVAGLRFRNADAAGVVEGDWHATGQGPGVIDLKGRLQDADATRVARYLPVHIGRPVRDWVARSVLAGRGEQADFRLRGDLRDFPFRDPSRGDFHVAVRLHDGTLRYAPDWPAIDEVQGDLVFERESMRIEGRAARVFGVRLADVRATIADFAHPVLRVEGGGTGPAQDMLRFVNQSPLRTTIDDFTADVAASGNAALALRLEMPLHDLHATRVDGGVTFAGNDVVLDRTLPRFDAVRGRLAFTQEGFTLRDLQATFLGGPLRVSGETVEPGRMRIRADGTVSVDGLRAVVDNPLMRRLSGQARYTATIDVNRRASALRVESDLMGLASRLPAPFDKPAAQALPLRIDATPGVPEDARARPGTDVIRATLGEGVQAVFERRRQADDQKLRIQRAALAVGTEPVLPDEGFALRLEGASLDVDAWHAVLGDEEVVRGAAGGSDEFAPGFSLLPSQVAIVAERLHVAGKDMHDVVLGATRAGSLWRANVRAREIDGHFTWREAGHGQPVGTLAARFTRLAIPASRAGEFESLLDSAPEVLPAMDIAADELVLGDVALGPLELVASNQGQAANPVWRIERLRIGAPAPWMEEGGQRPAGRLEGGDGTPGGLPATAVPALFVAEGRWSRRAGDARRSTDLSFELTLHDTGRLLERFGLRDAVRGGQGVLSGRIGWTGSPLSIDYPSLDGRMRLDMGRGQFLKVEPGVAKLIGVLNLQSVPRRLSLDFRDLFADGFAFDRIEGNVRIDRGIARTQDFRMRGLQAAVRIRGDADLARETQSLQVRVVPQLDASLASIAYAALANPAVGLGTFIAQYVLRRPLQQLFAYDLAITGPWSDPVVRKTDGDAPRAPDTDSEPDVPRTAEQIAPAGAGGG